MPPARPPDDDCRRARPCGSRPVGEAGRRFEYGWVRGCGSAGFIVGSGWLGASCRGGPRGDHIGGSAFLVAAAGVAMRVWAGRTPAERSLAAHPSVWFLLHLPSVQITPDHRRVGAGKSCHARCLRNDPVAAAGIAPTTASLLWSESELLVFFVLGPWLLHRIDASTAMAIAAVAAPQMALAHALCFGIWHMARH
jgi:MFS transporter, PPP family, 3-phenylpropionic acid transporter